MKCFLLIFLLITASGLLGCEKALFTEKTPRTQFERFDRMRGRYVPAEQFNADGTIAPALRERLNSSGP